MTRIYAEHGTMVGRCYLRIKDHAEGSEQVCAAISGLAYALMGYLYNATGVDVRTNDADTADVTIEFWGDQMSVGAYKCVIIGLAQIAKAHPDLVDMDYVESKK